MSITIHKYVIGVSYFCGLIEKYHVAVIVIKSPCSLTIFDSNHIDI